MSIIRRAGRAVLALAGAYALASGRPAAGQTIDTLALRAHTFFLSHDLLAGRGAGSPGERAAALYIESQLRRLGLEPAVEGSYRQPIPLRAVHIDDGTALVVRSNGDSTSFVHGRDFILDTGAASAFRDFAGDAVLLTAMADGAMDVEGPGRVVVIPGTIGAEALHLVPQWEKAGVQAVVQLVPDSARFALIAASRGADRFFLDADVDDPVWQGPLPTIVAGPALSRALLADVTVPDSQRQRQAAAIPLNRHLRFTFEGTEQTLPSANVAAILRGTHPALRDEFVVYTAHYDHLGVESARSGDSIYNGFSDNAAGVAMLLAIADALRSSPPDRSVAFVFLAAEERGLLGASFAAASPFLPLDRIAGLINLDAGAPPAPPVSWRIAGGEGTALGAVAAELAHRNGWSTRLTAASPNSDYWPFVRRGVPAIFLIPGDEWEGTSSEQRDALRARWDRYHRPDDEWAADFPFAGLARYAEFALEVGRAVANARDTPGH